MRRRRTDPLAALIAVLAMAGGARAAAPERHGLDDEARPGITYADLLRQASADLAEREGTWLGGSGGLRHLLGKAYENEPAELVTDAVETLVVRDGGKPRLLVLALPAGDSFEALLAVFDDGPRPRLLDDADVGTDRLTGFARPAVMAIAPDTDAAFVQSGHDNSNQSYRRTIGLFVRGGRLQPILDVFTFGEAGCGHASTQTPEFAVSAEAGPGYRPVVATVTAAVRRTREACDASARRPPPSKRTYRTVYRWDAARGRYQPAGRELRDLERRDEKRF